MTRSKVGPYISIPCGGMAAGAGYYALAVATTGLAVAVLLGLYHWPHRASESEK